MTFDVAVVDGYKHLKSALVDVDLKDQYENKRKKLKNIRRNSWNRIAPEGKEPPQNESVTNNLRQYNNVEKND
jgi:hypothetical protein